MGPSTRHCRAAAAQETTGAAGQTSSERHTCRTSPRKPGQIDYPYYPQSLFTSFRSSASLGEGASKASNIVRITLQSTRKIILSKSGSTTAKRGRLPEIQRQWSFRRRSPCLELHLRFWPTGRWLADRTSRGPARLPQSATGRAK